MRRLGLAVLALWFAAGVAWAAPPAKLTVTLPDAGTYSLWVQAKSGAVSVLPVTVSHKPSVILPNAAAGDTVYVLDAHTGQVAARPVVGTSPVALTVGDFKALTAPIVPTVSETPRPVPPAASAPAEPHTSGIAQFFTWILGLAVAAGVAWVLFRLITTRGEPLIALARKAGVDVPDPKPLDPEAEKAAMPVFEAPRPRTIEKIPDEAGAEPPVPVRTPPPTGLGGNERSSTGEPQLVGLQGLAAGSTFALSDGEVTVGRDGDNSIVLAETTVSRRHARLVRDSSGAVTVSDAGSANGIFVNGQRVQQARLVPGDQVQIGDNYFRFES